MKIIDYAIVQGHGGDLPKLVELCKACIKEGWQPFGPLVTYNGFYQVFVLYAKSDNHVVRDDGSQA